MSEQENAPSQRPQTPSATIHAEAQATRDAASQTPPPAPSAPPLGDVPPVTPTTAAVPSTMTEMIAELPRDQSRQFIREVVRMRETVQQTQPYETAIGEGLRAARLADPSPSEAPVAPAPEAAVPIAIGAAAHQVMGDAAPEAVVPAAAAPLSEEARAAARALNRAGAHASGSMEAGSTPPAAAAPSAPQPKKQVGGLE